MVDVSGAVDAACCGLEGLRPGMRHLTALLSASSRACHWHVSVLGH